MAQLKYALDLNLKAYPNELTPDVDNDYTVKVHTQSTPLTQEDIAASVADRLGEEPARVKSIIEIFMEEVSLAVASGYCVSADAFYARPVASGVVTDDELSQAVDREQVKVYASFRQGPAVEAALQKAKLHYFLQPAATGPYIAGMTSAFTDATTRVPLPMAGGEMAVLTGSGLKLVGDDPSVGITLTSVSDPDTSFFIPPVKVSPNTPKKLQFSLPAGVTEGEWTVQVTTQYSSGSTLTKEPRTFTLPHSIVVGEVTEPGGSDDDDSGQGTFG